MSKNSTDHIYRSYRVDDDLRFYIGGDSSALKEMKDIKKEDFMKALEKSIKELEKHFKEDGWDIDATSIIDDVLYDLLGFHLTDNIKTYVNSKLGTVTEYKLGKKKSGRAVFCKPRTFVYYDAKKDKITTSKNSKPKLELIGIL